MEKIEVIRRSFAKVHEVSDVFLLKVISQSAKFYYPIRAISKDEIVVGLLYVH